MPFSLEHYRFVSGLERWIVVIRTYLQVRAYRYSCVDLDRRWTACSEVLMIAAGLVNELRERGVLEMEL